MTKQKIPFPVRGVHFCEQCGDCLVCYDEDDCYFADTGKHDWPHNPNEKGFPFECGCSTCEEENNK